MMNYMKFDQNWMTDFRDILTDDDGRQTIAILIPQQEAQRVYTSHMSCKTHGFREDFFLKYFCFESMEANDRHGLVNLDPWGIYVRV